ncbi:class I SAM-dependent DNA methyltransferase [Streptomyces sp. NPDC096030]|uniref:type I restriction-modification system subunit M n=1 Tax=Streptomyces sp. NPDC096030 TaxID=3155423 RepID=UPI00331CAAFF
MEPQEGTPGHRTELPGAADAMDVDDVLWQAVDTLRGPVDATVYKDFVLGLIFLRYVSEAFDERRSQLAEELAAQGLTEDLVVTRLEAPEEYTRAGVPWVPQTARWSSITATLDGRLSGRILDEAMEALMRENHSLRGALPVIFQHSGVPGVRLDELVRLVGAITVRDVRGRAQDVGGAVYEYVLARFADMEGRRGGEFLTPRSVVRLIVEMLRPREGRLYDPACGSGGMFVEAARFVRARSGQGNRSGGLRSYGQEVHTQTWRLATMNLAIHGMHGDLADGPSDSLVDDQYPGLEADFVMSAPPFNLKRALNRVDPRWQYGVPREANTNYAWLQNAIAKLGRRGTAGIVLANGSLHSTVKADVEIRRAMLEEDLVECIVALPDRLFRTTQIPASLWMLTKDKPAARRGSILFMDAREMGTFETRTERVLTASDLTRIARTYHEWRGPESTGPIAASYVDVPGFCVSEPLESVRRHGYDLTPGRFVGARPAAPEPPREMSPDVLAELTRDLYALFD